MELLKNLAKVILELVNGIYFENRKTALSADKSFAGSALTTGLARRTHLAEKTHCNNFGQGSLACSAHPVEDHRMRQPGFFESVGYGFFGNLVAGHFANAARSIGLGVITVPAPHDVPIPQVQDYLGLVLANGFLQRRVQ
jgi:hypothetical protein